MPPDPPCPLCRSGVSGPYFKDDLRDYRLCPVCDVVFVPPEHHLSLEDEKRRYDLHRNDPADPGYRNFLDRLVRPLSERLEPGSSGLDVGCGPGPVLADLFRAAGHSVQNYDPIYAPDASVFSRQYDFVTATEVAEHLRTPEEDLARMWTAVRPGGWLGIMTQLRLTPDRFAAWHYKRDPTHILFYSRTTLEWLSARWEAELLFADKDILLLHKTRAGGL